MPDVLRIGQASGAGSPVNLLDTTRYRVPTASFRRKLERSRVIVPLVGGGFVVSRSDVAWVEFEYDIYCVRSGYQNKLDDFNAIVTMISTAETYDWSGGTAIYYAEQYGTQSSVLEYRIKTGEFDNLTRPLNYDRALIGHLHLYCLNS